jgi:predicted NAD/FAD-binding protein
MIFDVLRFNLFALDILKEEGTDDMSIGEYLDREGYGDGFKEDYLLVRLTQSLYLGQN